MAGTRWEKRYYQLAAGIVFKRNILTELAKIPLRPIAEATGLFAGYCAFVRRGLKVTHRRH